MTVLDILHYPDPRLRETGQEITDFNQVQQFIDDLVDTLYHAPGCVGVAAPQVGQRLQLLVMDSSRARKPPPGHHGLLVVANPVILAWSGMAVGREGCLSLPAYTGNVVRAVTLTARFQDRHGHTRTLELADFEARVFQHEMDHLEGRLFIDRVVSRKADLFPRQVYQQAKSQKTES